MASGRKAPRTAFKKGHKKLGGRKKGTPNKLTTDLRRHILNAINNLPGQLSGEGWLESLAKKDKRSYANLLGKIIPQSAPTVDPEEVGRKIRGQISEMDDVTQTKPDEEKK